MPDVPSDFFDDGAAEELYKILRKSEAWNQHIIASDTYTFQMYRPYCHGGLPIFTIGNHQHRNPAETADIISVMTAGVIEGPVQGDDPSLGDTVYFAHDGTDPYLTVDQNDSDAVCCWGIIIDDQRPIHYGETPLVGDDADLYSIRMIPPTCGDINSIGES